MGNSPVRAYGLEQGRFVTLTTDGVHGGIADEPTALGGLGLGPDPYGLLLMSLGACTAMTLRLYAQRNKWPLERVEVELEHSRVHADDCAECDSRDVFIERIERKILVVGSLSAEQEDTLLRIADRCPIHQTLTARMAIVTVLSPQPNAGLVAP